MLDASGIIHINNGHFLVAEDESDLLQIFILDKARQTFNSTGKTLNLGKAESDFESLAYDDIQQRYFCIGSHGEDYSQRLASFRLDVDQPGALTELNFDANRKLAIIRTNPPTAKSD